MSRPEKREAAAIHGARTVTLRHNTAAALSGALALAALSACGATTEDRAVTVPRLAGDQIDTARRALDGEGLEVSVREQWSEREPAGSVLSVRPREGANTRQGAAIKLTVSKGPAPGPHGALAAASVGPVKIGAPASEVVEQFGPPDEKQPVHIGVGPPPQELWTWADPKFTLTIDRELDATRGYCTTSPEFETRPLGLSAGVTGSAVTKVAARSGQQPSIGYDPRPAGERRNVMLSAAKPGSYPALRFNAEDDGTVSEICGGYLPPD